MPLATFNKFLLNIISLATNELDFINSIVKVRSFKKREILLHEGDICNECYFVAEGLLRNVVINEKGEEITTYFTPENTFVIDYSSYLLNQPSLFTIQALEPSSVVILNRKAIELIHNEVREGNKLGRLLAESQFILFIRKQNSQYRHSLEEQYKQLNVAIPGIDSRVPQHMIASYLGISRVHLSRLKKNF